MNKTCLVVGAQSDIFNGIRKMMEADHWVFYDAVNEISNTYPAPQMPKWDLLLITMGKVAPVGHWWDMLPVEFADCIHSNLVKPWEFLRLFWHWRSYNPTVIWFSGSNPQGIMDGYAPYNTAKMAVNKLIEQLDHETPDCKFVAFGPGYVRDSKIHRATLEKHWPNPRIARGDAGTSMEQIYAALKWCIEQPKSVVGGRNIAVSDLREYYSGDGLTSFIERNPDSFKLRRV